MLRQSALKPLDGSQAGSRQCCIMLSFSLLMSGAPSCSSCGSTSCASGASCNSEGATEGISSPTRGGLCLRNRVPLNPMVWNLIVIFATKIASVWYRRDIYPMSGQINTVYWNLRHTEHIRTNYENRQTNQHHHHEGLSWWYQRARERESTPFLGHTNPAPGGGLCSPLGGLGGWVWGAARAHGWGPVELGLRRWFARPSLPAACALQRRTCIPMSWISRRRSKWCGSPWWPWGVSPAPKAKLHRCSTGGWGFWVASEGRCCCLVPL